MGSDLVLTAVVSVGEIHVFTWNKNPYIKSIQSDWQTGAVCDTRNYSYTTLHCNQICKYSAQTLGPSHTTQACDITTIHFAGDTEDGANVYISKTNSDKNQSVFRNNIMLQGKSYGVHKVKL
jgi:hypothetical protein